MYRKIFISLIFAVLCCTDALAFFQEPVDSLDLSDSAFFSVMQSAQTDTAVVEKDRGYDVSGMVNAKRWRPADAVEFKTGSFSKNIFVAPYLRTLKILNSDYSFSYGGGVSVGKWVYPYLAGRVGLSWGCWTDNFDSKTTQSIDLTATAIFNLSSYIGGYDTSRFCEISILGGIGGLVDWKRGTVGGSFSGHVGANVNMRIFDRFNLFIEPQIGIHTNGLALSVNKNWRSYLLTFSTSVGVSYSFGQVRPQNERLSGSWKVPKKTPTGYFISLMAGTQFQNSRLVFESIQGAAKLGERYTFSVGRHFNDFIALRFSGSYSKNNWICYNDGRIFPEEYINVSIEAMFDAVRFAKYILARKGSGKEQGWFGCSVVAGPEMGRIIKNDVNERLSLHYVGIVGGIHPEFRVHKNISFFVEPRFAIIPYSAESEAEVENNNRNYYDALFNFNGGMEIRF